MLKQLLNEDQLAEILQVSVKKLRQDRQYRRGVPYKKIGRAVRYCLHEVECYLQDNTVRPTSS